MVDNNSYKFSFDFLEYLEVPQASRISKLPHTGNTYPVGNGKSLELYLNILRSENKSKPWQHAIERWLLDFNNAVDIYNALDVIKYIGKLRKQLHPTTFLKRYHQIKRLLKYLKMDCLEDYKIEKPRPPRPKIVTKEDVKDLLVYLWKKDPRHFVRNRAFVVVLATSGLRNKETWQLTLKDLNLQRNMIYVRSDKEHSQKIQQSRTVFITDNACHCLTHWLKQKKCHKIFNESSITRVFRGANIHMKDLRKFFSQQWIRNGGDQATKEILLGHSIVGNIDLQFYCMLSEKEMYEIYRKIMD